MCFLCEFHVATYFFYFGMKKKGIILWFGCIKWIRFYFLDRGKGETFTERASFASDVCVCGDEGLSASSKSESDLNDLL